MSGQRQGVRSIKPPLVLDTAEIEENGGVSNNEQKQHDILITVNDMQHNLFTDQTGKFPHTSSQDNKYHMILHEIVSHSTWFNPMKNCTKGEIISARQRALTLMQLCSLNPKHQMLDNEALAKYKEAIRASGMTYQLVPHNNHCHNIYKKAIHFWKDHFYCRPQ